MIYPESFEKKIGFEAVRRRLAELCVSPGARVLADEMAFLTDFDNIKRLLVEVSEMSVVIAMADGFGIRELGDPVQSLGRLKLQGTFLSPQEIVELRRVIEASVETEAWFRTHRTDDGQLQFEYLDEIASQLTPLPETLREIDRIIDRHGSVKDSASPELAEIRREMSSISGRVNSIMRRVISRAASEGYLEADTTPTMRDGRLVLPVQPMHKRHIPGIVHDESASGKTFFIEPAEIVEANNRVRELQLEERREITRILVALADRLRPDIPSLMLNIELLFRFDFIHAKARYAAETGAVMPHISHKTELEWYHATHPVLMASLRRQGKEIVPLDITLTFKDRILVISGPNAGGKSVCLKTVGIVQYMIQCGLLPPVYENSHVGIFDSIFIDIGDDQSIEDDLSTYSSHLRNMKRFLQSGNEKTLILIDEFGSGTEPQIGGALAQAILGEFNNKKMWGVITTHFQNLKTFAEDTPGLINGSMLYDRHLMQPMFKLSIGNPGSSFAIEIARKTGLPKSIIDEAEKIVGSDYINLDKYLLDITRDKRYWENKRSEIKIKEKRLDEVIQRYQSDAENLSDQRRQIIADAKQEARSILERSNASIERTIHDIKKAQAQKEATMEARRRLQEEKNNLTDSVDEHPLLRKAKPRRQKNKQPQPLSTPAQIKELQVGDVVKLDGEGTPGRILKIEGKKAEVAFGVLKTTVQLDRLKPTTAQIKTGAEKSTYISTSTTDSSRQRQLNFKPEIDVRGMRADESIQAVTYFLDDAIQFGSSRVRILHGTGTGALRQALRAYLDTHPGVTRYADEDVRFGGAGITVVNLA
ncbi:MAG: Smr/MutS family protein [Muribaculaceae bacterium]|nr:Smr/MutS family protein [Muribaculaceae bacterium]